MSHSVFSSQEFSHESLLMLTQSGAYGMLSWSDCLVLILMLNSELWNLEEESHYRHEGRDTVYRGS